MSKEGILSLFIKRLGKRNHLIFPFSKLMFTHKSGWTQGDELNIKFDLIRNPQITQINAD